MPEPTPAELAALVQKLTTETDDAAALAIIRRTPEHKAAAIEALDKLEAAPFRLAQANKPSAIIDPQKFANYVTRLRLFIESI